MGIRTPHRRTALGLRTVHRRTAMATTVVIATATVAAAVVPVLFAQVPAVAAEAATVQLPGSGLFRAGPSRADEDREEDFGARLSRDLQAALSARPGTVLVSVPDPVPADVGARPAGARVRRLPVALADGARAVLSSGAHRLRLLARLRDGRGRSAFFGLTRALGAHTSAGRLPRAGNGGRVHGIGTFTGPARSYRVIVLSYDQPTPAYGAGVVQRVVRAVHRSLGQGRGLLRTLAAGAPVSVRRDGSAPQAPERDRDEPERDARS
ncbi:hypothetical protein [Streptomyces aureus]|uniref:hypothetical protein n=1 Tax=Streptomyces aureus TaxID=193461 RepID=UPI00367909B1